MTLAAQGLLVFFGVWLIAVGALMVVRPKKALFFLSKAASTALLNYGEITLRLITGLAFVHFADYSRSPEILQIFGWFLIVTSIFLYLTPRAWHARYATWWSAKLDSWMVRIFGSLSITGGALLIFAVA